MTTEDTGRKSKANSGDVTVLVEADQSDDRVVCVDHLLTERPLLQHLLGDVGGQNAAERYRQNFRHYRHNSNLGCLGGVPPQLMTSCSVPNQKSMGGDITKLSNWAYEKTSDTT